VPRGLEKFVARVCLKCWVLVGTGCTAIVDVAMAADGMDPCCSVMTKLALNEMLPKVLQVNNLISLLTYFPIITKAETILASVIYYVMQSFIY